MTARTNIFQGQRFSNGAFSFGGSPVRVYDFLGTGTSFLASKKVSLFSANFGLGWVSYCIITNLVADDLLGFDYFTISNINADESTNVPIVGFTETIGFALSNSDILNSLIQSSHVFKRDGVIVPENEYMNYLIFYANNGAFEEDLEVYESNIGVDDLVLTLHDSTLTLTDSSAQIGGLDKSSMPLITSNTGSNTGFLVVMILALVAKLFK